MRFNTNCSTCPHNIFKTLLCKLIKMLRGKFSKVGENQRQKHKVCKTKVQVEFYFNIV